jgi:solute carrier family 35 protein F1/2
VTGLELLVASDQITKKDYVAVNKGKGDVFLILSATLYGFSVFEQGHSLNGADGKHVANTTEEFFVHRRPLFQVVGQLGMWGTGHNHKWRSSFSPQTQWNDDGCMEWPQWSVILTLFRVCSLILGLPVGLLFPYTTRAGDIFAA